MLGFLPSQMRALSNRNRSDVQVTRYWKSLQNLLKSLISSIEAIASLLVLLFLFLGIFALLGTQVPLFLFIDPNILWLYVVQLFGGRFIERKFPGTPNMVKSRMNFDSFFNSFFSCFQVIPTIMLADQTFATYIYKQRMKSETTNVVL